MIDQDRHLGRPPIPDLHVGRPPDKILRTSSASPPHAPHSGSRSSSLHRILSGVRQLLAPCIFVPLRSGTQGISTLSRIRGQISIRASKRAAENRRGTRRVFCNANLVFCNSLTPPSPSRAVAWGRRWRRGWWERGRGASMSPTRMA